MGKENRGSESGREQQVTGNRQQVTSNKLGLITAEMIIQFLFVMPLSGPSDGPWAA